MPGSILPTPLNPLSRERGQGERDILYPALKGGAINIKLFQS